MTTAWAPVRVFLVFVSLHQIVIARENSPILEEESSPRQQDAEAELLEGLHYSNAEFMRLFDSLPRDAANRVDWEQAKVDGLIEPLPAIDGENVEEKIFDLRVVIKFEDMLVKNVVFSHAVHTYWLDCSSCHPKLFIPQVAANKMTMQEIKEGKYCGKCHGAVAFPTQPHSLAVSNFRAVCKRCHLERRE